MSFNLVTVLYGHIFNKHRIEAQRLLEDVYMRPKVNSNRFKIYFGVKFHFRIRQLHCQRSHDFRQSQTHFGAMTEVKLQTTMCFPCK